MIVESTEAQIKHGSPNIANAVLGAVPVHKFPYNWNLKDANFTKDKGNCGSLLFSKPIRLSKQEFCNIGTFPQDYNFTCNFGYLIGMSVPPVMTAQIANQIYKQWLSVM